MTVDPTTPEFSRPIELERVGDAELSRSVSATAEERARLARRLGIPSIERLEAEVKLRRERAGALLRLRGHMIAEVTQTCVVTLEPVHNRLVEDFTVLYGEVPAAAAIEMDPDAEEEVEPWPEGPLDVGEAIAQELSLALDPYPRAPGAAAPTGDEPDAVSEKVNPFAGLGKLRRKLT